METAEQQMFGQGVCLTMEARTLVISGALLRPQLV